MAYKKCGFRKINLCKFREEDCRPDKCDMYDIPFNVKGILKQAKIEREAVTQLTNKMVKMKKAGEHKTNKDKYDEIKKLRSDKVYGMLKLSKAYMHCKRTN
jgi:hypothetical protein